MSRRGQVVVGAAVVAAVALLALVGAYLQLGYAGDVAAADPGDRPAVDAVRGLERSANTVVPDLARDHAWRDRREAVEAFEDAMTPRIDALRQVRLGDGVVYRIAYNATVAAAWRRADCPRGPGRRFGGCRAIGGVVVQNRAGRTHVLAAAFDVAVVSPDGRVAFTVVVRRW